MTTNLLLHVDADSFFASVALRHRPDLANVPVAAVAHVYVASANYPARARGVRGGAVVQEALRVCPELIPLDVPRAEVEEVGDALFDLFHDCAQAVEPGSIEEAFVDVGATGWAGAIAAGQALRRRAALELGIPVSVGIGRTKLMAKLASRAAKPDGLHVIGDERAAELRTVLSIDEVWGIGSVTVDRLRQLGVLRLGDVDGIPRDDLQRVCGTAIARRLWQIRDGTDDAVVRPVEGRSTLSAEGSTAGYERRDWAPVELLDACVGRACHRAERAGLLATGVTVTLKPASGEVPLVLKHRAADATATPDALLPALRAQLEQSMVPRLLGVRVTLTGLLPADRAPVALF